MKMASSEEYLSGLLLMVLGSVEMKDWVGFEAMAIPNAHTFSLLSNYLSKCEDFNGMTLLHAIVRHDPPNKLLRRMIKLYPEALISKDCLGRTPLHVATGSGSDECIIKVLVVSCPEACNAQDEDGRTPLHFACDSSCELFEDDEDHPRGPPDFEIVRTILAGSKKAVCVEDIDEMNALEYAILSGAPMKVVGLLQKTTQKQEKKNQIRSQPPQATQMNVVGSIRV